MEKSSNLSSYQWLEDYRDSKYSQRPLRLKNFIPNRFDNYYGIVWNVGIIEKFPFDNFIKNPDTENEIKNNRIIWNEFPSIFNGSDEGFNKISIRELFSKFDVPFHPYKNDGMLPWHTKAIKVLFNNLKEDLSSILNSFQKDIQLNMYWEDNFRFGDENKFSKVSANEFLNKLEESGFDSSVYLFPESKDWCFINLEDLCFSILAFNDNVKNIDLSKMETFKLIPDDVFFK